MGCRAIADNEDNNNNNMIKFCWHMLAQDLLSAAAEKLPKRKVLSVNDSIKFLMAFSCNGVYTQLVLCFSVSIW